MYNEVLEAIAHSAQVKLKLLRTHLSGSLMHSAMGGAYVGLGIALMYVLGAPLYAARSPVLNLVMGASFGIALSLVIMAGSDLFTGNTMMMTVAALSGRVTWLQVLRVLGFSFLGNLLGGVLVAVLIVQAHIFATEPGAGFVLAMAAKKMHYGFSTLFVRGILCNWLVVLSYWCSYRLKSESAKLIMIFWAHLGFIASGYEHSVANMTLLTLANLLPHGPDVSWAAMVGNLIPVTLGNIVSGALFMGAAYWYISPVHTDAAGAAH